MLSPKGAKADSSVAAPAGGSQQTKTDAGSDLPSEAPPTTPPPVEPQLWNWHFQNTDIVQADPAFTAKYSGPNSLYSHGEMKETTSADLYAGLRLWPGAEAHLDGLFYQGYGLSDAVGVEGFPNGEAERLGTDWPHFNLARAFVRQTIGFGGEQEDVPDDQLTLAGKRDISRLTITAGRFSVKDIFDNNAYANDPRTQFMNWALMANEAWDYPADSLGFTDGLAIELNQPNWTARYGIFQVPTVSNMMNMDMSVLQAWGMVGEFERRFSVSDHPGAIRLLAFLNRAHMGSYADAVNSSVRPADITASETYRLKYGFGLNAEQEVAKNIGVFSRLGWSDGHTEAWCFSDVDETATAGLSVKGEAWHRAKDTFGLAGVLNGLSPIHQTFFEDGGTGILGGDGAMHYGIEQIIETYYDIAVWKTVHVALDYQFIVNPACNRDRGPVSVFALRIHWEL
jgi:high affinity Mn2+ porin